MKLTYCPFCLSAVQGEICPHCGKSIFYNGDPMHLQVGYVLNGTHPYVLGASLGQGGFGITYIALDIMTNCKRFVLENCSISNETMAQLRNDYRDRTKVVWRVEFGKGSTLTDVHAIRATHGLKDSTNKNLIA